MTIASLLRDIALQFPTALVYLAGLILALMLFGRLPRVALAAAGGFGLLLLLVLVRPLIYFAVNQAFRAGGNYENATVVFGVVGFFCNLLEATAMAPLLYAIFAPRPAAGSESN